MIRELRSAIVRSFVEEDRSDMEDSDSAKMRVSLMIEVRLPHGSGGIVYFDQPQGRIHQPHPFVAAVRYCHTFFKVSWAKLLGEMTSIVREGAPSVGERSTSR